MGCHIIHNARCEVGLKSQREVIVLAMATDKLTELWVDVDAWGHPGLPHIRLHFTVVDEEAHHHSSAMRKGQAAPAAAQAERAKTNKYGKANGGGGVSGTSLQLNGRFCPGLDAHRHTHSHRLEDVKEERKGRTAYERQSNVPKGELQVMPETSAASVEDEALSFPIWTLLAECCG